MNHTTRPNRHVHLFNLKYRKGILIDRRSEDLKYGHLREYENVSKSSLIRMLVLLNNLPHGTIIYPDGYTITYDDDISDGFEILAK